jgi:hypothetical protein
MGHGSFFDLERAYSAVAKGGGMAERTPYQQKIIKNYYENREAIAFQRLSEIVTELYLAEGKARKKHWTQAAAAMEKLGLPKERIAHLVKQDDPGLLARLVTELSTQFKVR